MRGFFLHDAFTLLSFVSLVFLPPVATIVVNQIKLFACQFSSFFKPPLLSLCFGLLHALFSLSLKAFQKSTPPAKNKLWYGTVFEKPRSNFIQ
jgi:hypothetical protein